MSELAQTILLYAGAASAVAGIVGFLIKLFRMLRQIIAGQKCILRKQMLDTYYKCKDGGKIRQHMYENFDLSYKAYKALGGNSFIDHIKGEVDEFDVVT